MPDNQEFLTYKGRPMVRSGNVIYYGSMSDPYVIKLEILNTKKVGDLDVADKVSLKLMRTDENLRPKEKIAKQSEKPGLYNAMDVGAIWLERALAE